MNFWMTQYNRRSMECKSWKKESKEHQVQPLHYADEVAKGELPKLYADKVTKDILTKLTGVVYT